MNIAFAAAPGTAGATEIEVLSFASNDAVEEALALTDAMKHALIEAQGVAEHTPGSGKGHALEAEALTVGCDDPMAAACAPKMAKDLKWDQFVYGTVKKTGSNKLTATLNYYNKGDIKTVAKTYDAGPVAKDGASPELKAIALDALYSLVGGPPKSKVEVTLVGPAANESGDLYEGAQKVGHVEGGHATVELVAGSHTLELKGVDGYGDTSGTVEVGGEGGSELKLSPVKLEGGKGLDWKLYGGIGAIAVGAVFIGVGVATSLSVHDAQNDGTFHDYQLHFPDPNRFSNGTSDVCSEAQAGHGGSGPSGPAPQSEIDYVKDFCDSTHKKQVLQWVWYGLGVAFIAGGTVLILTDDKNKGSSGEAAPEPKASKVNVKLMPSFGPHDGFLSLVGTF